MPLENALGVHPAAAIFPRMTDAEFEDLKRDIDEHGQLEEIVVCQREILDGRSRLEVCLKLGITPKFCEVAGPEPYAFAISKNLRRRHLNASQRALIAAEVADLPWGGARTKPQTCALTHSDGAKALAVSERQVDQASALLNAVKRGRAIPELVEHVRIGHLRLNRVRRLLYDSLDEQRAFLAEASRPPTRSPDKHTRWVRRLEKVKTTMLCMGSPAFNLAERAARAGELTADRCNQLASANRTAAYRLMEEADRIERLRGMPFEQPCWLCGNWRWFTQSKAGEVSRESQASEHTPKAKSA